MEDRQGNSDGSPVPYESALEAEPQIRDDKAVMEGDRTETEGDVATQLSQLQCMAREMKTGFTQAMEALQDIQYGDQQLEATVQHNKAECEQQLGDVVQMVLALKSEFGGVVAQLKLANETQRTLQRHVDMLQCERDILLEELERSGSISSQLRQKYHSGQDRPNGLNRSSDSTSLSALLERARNTFNSSGHHSSNSSSHLTSDHDSGVMNTAGGDASLCDEVSPPPVMSPIVQSYIAGLQDTDQVEELPLDENYDSDSSLTATINKSLDLGRSLGDKCSELTKMELSDEDTEESRGETGGKEEGEGGCMGSMQPCSVPLDGQPSAHSSPMKMFSPRRIPPHERNARETQRLRVAREILDTERKYCSALWTILDRYEGSLKQLGILSLKDISVMFPPCLSTIYEQHCRFLQTLEDRLVNWQWQCVLGDVFARFSDTTECDLLQHYQTYVNEFPAALHQIRKSCSNNRRFKQFLKMSQRATCCDGLDIGAFLLTPIQRVPRYVLLLKQLLKYTDKGHPDCYYIDRSLQKLAGFLGRLNDSIQYSVQMVTADVTPKPKRRLWLGSSFRSNASSHDGDMMLSTSTKDSGVHSGHDDDQLTESSSSTSRLFQFGLAPSKQKTRSSSRCSDSSGVSDQPILSCVPTPHILPPESTNTCRLPQQVASPQFNFKVPASASFHERWTAQKPLCDVQSLTKPARKTKLRQKPRAKTTEIHFNPTVDYAPTGSVTKLRGHPPEVHASSNVEKLSSGHIFTSPNDRQISHDPVESVTLDRAVGRTTHHDRRAFSSYSMPRAATIDYGIFGNADVDETDDTDPQMSPRDIPSNTLQSQRCYSQGNVNSVVSLHPPQGVINKSLAKSLIDVHRDPFCTTRSQRDVGRQLLQQHQQLSDCVWSEGSLADMSAITVASFNGGGDESKKGVKKRKKDKKVSLKDSFRNIFFKKRNPKIDRSSPSLSTRSSLCDSASPDSIHRVSGSALYKIREQEAPLDNSVSLPRVVERRPDLALATFEDENGDPCSAV